MGSLAAVADRLRVVRRARRHFLKMWAIDRTLVEPALDRVAQDLDLAGKSARPPQSPYGETEREDRRGQG